MVWIWEGLVPKILWPIDIQRDLVIHSGLYWPDPDRLIILLGIAGIIVCSS
jgi:hypothetical protein